MLHHHDYNTVIRTVRERFSVFTCCNCSIDCGFHYIASELKTAAFIFLALAYLVNVFGYAGFFFGWEALNTGEVHSELDSDIYAGSETIILRIPLALPYYSNHSNYERANGVFEYEGAIYRLVKQKLYNDTLYMICSKHKAGKYIMDAIQELAYSMHGHPTGNKTSPGKTGSSFSLS